MLIIVSQASIIVIIIIIIIVIIIIIIIVIIKNLDLWFFSVGNFAECCVHVAARVSARPRIFCIPTEQRRSTIQVALFTVLSKAEQLVRALCERRSSLNKPGCTCKHNSNWKFSESVESVRWRDREHAERRRSQWGCRSWSTVKFWFLCILVFTLFLK